MSAIEVQQLVLEILALELTTWKVDKVIVKFRERALFFLLYVASKEIRMTPYHGMLRTKIWEHMSISNHRTLSSLVEAARERELKLETQQ